MATTSYARASDGPRPPPESLQTGTIPYQRHPMKLLEMPC